MQKHIAMLENRFSGSTKGECHIGFWGIVTFLDGRLQVVHVLATNNILF